MTFKELTSKIAKSEGLKNMTFKELTSKIAKSEGLKKQTSIGNVREITRLILYELAHMDMMDRAKLLGKYAKRKGVSE